MQAKDVGDLSSRKALRERLNCKSFKWFLDNVIPGKFIMDEDVIAYGTLFTEADGSRMCTDTLQREEKQANNLGIFPCQGKGSPPQLMSLSQKNHLRRETNCASIFGSAKARSTVMMTQCSSGSDTWSYEVDYSFVSLKPLFQNKQLKHKKSGLCLTTRNLKASDDVVVDVCDAEDAHQKWNFVDPSKE